MLPRKKGKGQVQDERSDRKAEELDALMGLSVRSVAFDDASLVDSYLASRQLLHMIRANWLQSNRWGDGRGCWFCF